MTLNFGLMHFLNLDHGLGQVCAGIHNWPDWDPDAAKMCNLPKPSLDDEPTYILQREMA